MGISPGSPTTFWHNDGGFNTWLNEVLNTPNPPLVLSMSYGMQESMVSAGTHEAVTTAAKKLGIIGVTLVVASGDDGASGTDSRSAPPICAYQPYFPAGNPYFTAIGGTVVSLIRKTMIQFIRMKTFKQAKCTTSPVFTFRAQRLASKALK